MRKTLLQVVMLLTALSLVLSACGGGVEEVGGFQIPAVENGKFNVAMVLIGPHDDGGWSQAHYEGLLYIEENVPDVNIAYVENVPEGADSEQVFRALARKGFDLIFGTSFGFGDPMEIVAGEFPDTMFIHLTGIKSNNTNFGNLMGAMENMKFLAGMLAEMIGLNGDLARRCGLLHDIGKAADHELEGGHPKIGADLLKRHGESKEIVHAALGHHDEIITEYPYTMLVATGDACSASRPGARRESLERYIKRMEELETIATGFPGVEQAFAIQAGRELRVLVSARDTDDVRAARICRDIAKAFEEQLTYPGEIKVTVVRESRFTEIAR